MQHMGTKTLTTPRLVLRRYTLDDVDAMYDNWASDPAVTEHLTWETHPDKEVTRAVLETWVAQYELDSVYHWGIELDGVLIGDIAVVNGSWEDERCEVGYALSRAQWGKGIMTEALGRVLRFLFEEIGLHRVHMRHVAQNMGSGKVMLKNGLRHEGTMREHWRRPNGTWADIDYYGILRQEWMRRQAEGE